MLDQHYEDVSCFGKDFSHETMEEGIYEGCRFTSCNVSEGSLKNLVFVDCLFDSCNLSMCNVSNTCFQDVKFKDCKLMGVRFELCNPLLLSVEFEGCLMNMASFYRLKLPGTRFLQCNLQEVDFTETNLTKAFFKDCDMYKSIFGNTLLEGADFRTAENFSLDPEDNYIRKAKFTMQNIPGLLHKYDIEIE